MEEQQVADLIKKYNEGTLGGDEKLALDMWYLKYASESTAELSEVKENLMSAKLKSALPLKTQASVVKLWPRLAIAIAVATVILSVGMWFMMSGPSSRPAIHYANDVIPGKTGATLTLANGKKIYISDADTGLIANESGVLISKSADGQLIYEIAGGRKDNGLNTLSTSYGEIFQVKLPDGSQVWLNAASDLSYSTALNENGIRKVKLTGEAYFEIEKDAAHPFIVESEGQELKVLGTHFNVKAYREENGINTTLLEGSIRLNSSSAPQVSVILKPGEQAINNGHIQIEAANLEEAVAWKNGNTVFKEKSLESIMQELSRWYNITVVYAADAPKNEPFSGAVSRGRNLSAVLERMQSTGSVRFAIEGKTVTVMK